MSDRNIVYDPDKSFKVVNRKMLDGETKTFSLDANMWAVRDSTSLSSAVWTVEQGNNITVGSDNEAANVSTAALTATTSGSSLIKITLTMADGQVGVVYLEIHVPNLEGETDDYE